MGTKIRAGCYMRQIFTGILVLCMILAAIPAGARDFIVEFVEEHYKETQMDYSHSPMIYHSIQVTSDALVRESSGPLRLPIWGPIEDMSLVSRLFFVEEG